MTHIPAGARDIQIVERKKSADVLGTWRGPGGWLTRPFAVLHGAMCMGVEVELDPGCLPVGADIPQKPELDLGVGGCPREATSPYAWKDLCSELLHMEGS